jgi:hypothetical protein
MCMMYFLADFFKARDLIRLGTLRSLDDIELNLIAFFKALIAFALNGAVVNEDVCPAIPAEEAVTLSVVKPFYGAFVLCQWSSSLAFV